jgi:outer membrane biosynthesis protein TonB
MPLPAVLLALVLGALCALAVACGDTSELLTERRAARLTGDVDRVAEAVQQGDCEATAVRVQELQAEVADLPASLSAGLRRNLEDGVAQLAAQAQEECQGEQTDPAPVETEPAPEVETPATTETTEPPAETPTQTETTETTEPPAETTPAEPAPAPETTPADPAPDAGEDGDDGATGGTQGDAGTGGVDGGTS